MITRKAAIGFLLIAIIVFPIAYSSWVAPMPTINGVSLNLSLSKHADNSITSDTVYHTPKIQFKSPFDMAIAITGIIEIFTLVCYLGLKRIEPRIKQWEESERKRVKNQNSH